MDQLDLRPRHPPDRLVFSFFLSIRSTEKSKRDCQVDTRSNCRPLSESDGESVAAQLLRYWFFFSFSFCLYQTLLLNPTIAAPWCCRLCIFVCFSVFLDCCPVGNEKMGYALKMKTNNPIVGERWMDRKEWCRMEGGRIALGGACHVLFLFFCCRFPFRVGSPPSDHIKRSFTIGGLATLVVAHNNKFSLSNSDRHYIFYFILFILFFQIFTRELFFFFFFF